MFLRQGLQEGARRLNLDLSEFSAVWGQRHGVYIAPAGSWRIAIKGLQALAENYQDLVTAELAFWDEREQIWRTVHPMGAAPFERWFTPEIVHAARGTMESRAARVAAELERLTRPGEQDSGTDTTS